MNITHSSKHSPPKRKTFPLNAVWGLLIFVVAYSSCVKVSPSNQQDGQDTTTDNNTSVDFSISQLKMDNITGADIQGKHGTELHLPPGCFVDQQGNVIMDTICIELKEYLLVNAIPNNDPSAVSISNNNTTITDGIFELVGYYASNPLQVNPDIDIETILLE